jgi:hypothetical protein
MASSWLCAEMGGTGVPGSGCGPREHSGPRQGDGAGTGMLA